MIIIKDDILNTKARISILAFMLLMVLFISVSVIMFFGSENGVFWHYMQSFLISYEDRDDLFIIQELRLPRAIMGVLVGSALGLAGTIMQTITRNPLGDPTLTGVTSGAAAAIIFAFTFLHATSQTLIIWGISGGVMGATCTFFIARKTGFNPLHLTLAGVAVSIFFMALINLFIIINSQSINSSYFWLIGNLANRTWKDVYLVLPLVFLGLITSFMCSKHLNLLRLETENAQARGLNVVRWRLFFGLIAVILTAGCVTTCGPISFIGLIAPHVARIIMPKSYASDFRWLLPFSALWGAVIISLTDMISISKIMGMEIPTGLLCIVIGGITFLVMFQRKII